MDSEFIKPLRSIQELQGLTFYIDAYQRGYRWGIQEVLDLLEDVKEFVLKAENTFYCLQPLIVKHITETEKELIDGQQRATTIFLILTALGKKDFYQIRYQTRGDAEGINPFLGELPNYKKINELDLSGIINTDKQIIDFWKKEFSGKHEDTVDNFYLYRAYQVINAWIKSYSYENQETSIETYTKVFLEKCKVIWYEKSSEEDRQKNIFLNFNNGKINLDQAELIKALFVLNINKIDDSTKRLYEENQFADEWNFIEHKMQDEKFWNFVNSNKDEQDLANKINLLFQLKKNHHRVEDKMFAYRAFDKEFKDYEIDDVLKEWDGINDLFNKLEDWFNDSEFYNLIGAIIQLTDYKIKQLIEPRDKHGNLISFNDKNEIKTHFRSLLRYYFCDESGNKWKKDFDINNISYGHKNLHKILMLYNIAKTSENGGKLFFPFHIYKNIDWNHEHILAKNDKGFDDIESLCVWRDEMQLALEDYTLHSNAVSVDGTFDYENIFNNFDFYLKNQNVEDAVKEQKLIAKKLSDLLAVDKLNNLCLLDNINNIKISNKSFSQKRDFLLRLNGEKEDIFLPITTENAFAKKIVPKNIHTNFWSLSDRDYYFADINNSISKFLAI